MPDDEPENKKKCCGGVGADIIMVFMHAIVLGIDYTIVLSASAQYYLHLLATEEHENISFTVTEGPNGTGNASFCEPGSSEGDKLYSEQQVYWALAQLVGCVLGIFLPKMISYKGAFLVFTSLMAIGNALYGASTAQLLDMWELAMAGRIICGLGDGSIVLGLSYIPLKIKNIPVMRTALVNYRMFVAVGTTMGSLIAIGASLLSDPSKAKLDDDFSFNPANFAGFLLAFLCIVLFIGEAICIAPFKPPTQKGAVASPHWSWKILAWLFFVFTYGMLMGAVQYAVAIYCFYSDNQANLQTTQAAVLTVCFFAALLGAVTSSIVTGKGCAKKMPKNVNLQLVQYLTIVIIVGIAFIYAGEKLQGSPSDVGTSAIMIIGNLIFFYSVTALSAAKTPLFKKIVPRSAISATMPLYKIMLDVGKAVGPYWSEASMAAQQIDTAFAPYLILFCLISLFLFTRGTWMTTPDREDQAFCYKSKANKEDLLVGVGEFDPATGGGQKAKSKHKSAVTRGYAGIQLEDVDDTKTVQLAERQTDPAEKEAAANAGYGL